jgi:hypothetical protein
MKEAAPAAATASALAQALKTVEEGDVLSTTGLHAFLEAWRSLQTGLAFMAHAAATQMDAAMRQGAKNAADGRLTLQQKVELQRVLRNIRKDMDARMAEECLMSARAAVQAYGRMASFLDSLESDNVTRPHRRSNGRGFTLDVG